MSCFGVLGAYGASAANGSKRIAWRRCTFTDISAGAVMLGDFKSWNCNGDCLVVTLTQTVCVVADTPE